MIVMGCAFLPPPQISSVYSLIWVAFVSPIADSEERRGSPVLALRRVLVSPTATRDRYKDLKQQQMVHFVISTGGGQHSRTPHLCLVWPAEGQQGVPTPVFLFTTGITRLPYNWHNRIFSDTAVTEEGGGSRVNRRDYLNFISLLLGVLISLPRTQPKNQEHRLNCELHS